MNRTFLYSLALKLAEESKRQAERADPLTEASYTANMAASYICGAMATAISEALHDDK